MKGSYDGYDMLSQASLERQREMPMQRGKITIIWTRGDTEIAREEWEGFDMLRLTRRVQIDLRTKILPKYTEFMMRHRAEQK